MAPRRASLRLRADVHPRGLSNLHLEFTPIDDAPRWLSHTVSDFDTIDFFTDQSSSPTRTPTSTTSAALPVQHEEQRA
jgi:hypothetical protein